MIGLDVCLGDRDRPGCVSGGLVIGLAVCLGDRDRLGCVSGGCVGDRDRLGRVSGGCVSGGAEWKPHACAVATGADGGPAEASVRSSGRPPLQVLSRPSEPLCLFCGVKLVS